LSLAVARDLRDTAPTEDLSFPCDLRAKALRALRRKHVLVESRSFSLAESHRRGHMVGHDAGRDTVGNGPPCPHVPWWVTALLVLMCIGCSVQQEQGAQLASWRDAEDNVNLPQRHRLALLLTGLSKRGVIENVLRALTINVIQAAGGDGDVDVYVHTEAARDSNMSALALSELFHALLPSHAIRAVIVDSGGEKGSQMMTGLAGGGWKHKPHHLLQFTALQELYGMLLQHERTVNERYGYIARVRTDALMLSPWPSLLGGDASAPLWSQLSRLGTVAGPGWHEMGHKSDKFYIAGRSSGWKVFMELPLFFNFRISPEEAWRDMGCGERGPLDDYILASCDRWGCPRGGGARGCEFCCGDTSAGAKSPLVCPEVWVPLAFQRMGLILVDSCALTQHYAILGRHHPFEHHCRFTADLATTSGKAGVAAIGPARLAPPHPQHMGARLPSIHLLGPPRCHGSGWAILEILLSHLHVPTGYRIVGEVVLNDVSRKMVVASTLTAAAADASMFLGIVLDSSIAGAVSAQYRVSLFDAAQAMLAGADDEDDSLVARSSAHHPISRCPVQHSQGTTCRESSGDARAGGDLAGDTEVARVGCPRPAEDDMYELARAGGVLEGMEMYISLLRQYTQGAGASSARERMAEVLEQEIFLHGHMRSEYRFV